MVKVAGGGDGAHEYGGGAFHVGAGGIGGQPGCGPPGFGCPPGRFGTGFQPNPGGATTMKC